MEKNSMTIAKESSNYEISANKLRSNNPKESNTSNRVKKEKIIHDINDDLKYKKEYKINLDKEIKNIYLNKENSKLKDNCPSENQTINIFSFIYMNMNINNLYNRNKKKNKRKTKNINNFNFSGIKVLMIQLNIYILLDSDYKLIKFVNATNSKIIVKYINDDINFDNIINPTFNPKPENKALIVDKTYEIEYFSNLVNISRMFEI